MPGNPFPSFDEGVIRPRARASAPLATTVKNAVREWGVAAWGVAFLRPVDRSQAHRCFLQAIFQSNRPVAHKKPPLAAMYLIATCGCQQRRQCNCNNWRHTRRINSRLDARLPGA